jgi:predicted kinase
MIFQPPGKKLEEPKNDLIVNNIKIVQVKHTKFLGIIIDEKLKWTQHINFVKVKLQRGKFILRNSKNIIPEKNKISLYYAQVYSHLIYGMLIWGPMATAEQKNCINKLVNDCIRIIKNLKYNSHVTTHYKNLNLLKLIDIINLELVKFSYKFGHELLPDSILDILKGGKNI